MNRMFLEIINLSYIASFMTIFIILIRLLFKKVPKKYSYLLWILLLIRLIIPISFETNLNPIDIDKISISKDKSSINESVINGEMVKENIDSSSYNNTEISKNIDEGSLIENNINSNDFNNKMSRIRLEYIWLLGVIVLLFSGILSSYKLSKKLNSPKLIYDNVYENDFINTGFVYGLLRPIILVPSTLEEKERKYIIAHETIHLKRYDHIVKILYYIVLTIHWFNPLIWLAFRLMSKDMELSCDEAVLKDLEHEKKIEYAETLLSLAVAEPSMNSLLAFSKKDTKSRIKNALEFKKISIAISILLIAILIIIGLFMFTKPKQNKELVNNNPYGIENIEFKEPRDVADLIFEKEYENIIQHSDDDIKILEKGITNFEKVHSYSEYLNGNVDVYKLEYKIKAEDPEMFNVMEYQEDNSITEEKMSLGKPLLVFENKGTSHKYIGIMYLGGINIANKIGVEIELINFLELKGLKEKETFKGKHNLVEYKLREGGIHKILLSQPVKEGEDGIWCVDRWLDNHGNVYHYPYAESDLDLKSYYSRIQENGDDRLLDYKYVAQDFIKGLGFNNDNLDYKVDVGLEDFYSLPINKYYGYIMDIINYEWSENNFIHFDKVEYLTLEDEVRLNELGININSLPNGYYINNPASYPDSFIIEKDKNTKFYVLDHSGVKHKEIEEVDFVKYVENNNNILYEIVEKGFDIIEIREVYLP